MKRKHFDLYKIFIYVALISLAISIIIPVSWVFLASIKTNAEFYGNPWALPQGFNIQNFIDAFQIAQVGDFILNSALVTAMALAILLVVHYQLRMYLLDSNLKVESSSTHSSWLAYLLT